MYSFVSNTQAKQNQQGSSSTVATAAELEPVDIQYEKFKQWLLDRHMIPQQHIQMLKQIRVIVQEAWRETVATTTPTSDMSENKRKLIELIQKLQKQASGVISISSGTDNKATEENEEKFLLSKDTEISPSLVNYLVAKQFVSLIERVDQEESGDSSSGQSSTEVHKESHSGGGGYFRSFVDAIGLSAITSNNKLSKRLKLWNQVVTMYESKLIYMAELSSQMVQNVKYEIPALRKQVSKCKKLVDEWDRKEREWQKNVALYERKFTQECEQLGIGTDVHSQRNIENEMADLIRRELPSFYEKMERVSRDESMCQALNFYCVFTSFISGRDMTNDPNFMPMLKYLAHMNKNDALRATVYDYRKTRDSSDPSLQYDPIELREYEMKKKSAQNEIGETGSNETEDVFDAPLEIDWSAIGDQDEIVTGDPEHAEIIWDDIEVESSKTIEIDEFGEAELSLGSDDAKPIEDTHLERILQMMNESVFANDGTRNIYLDNVMELESFIDSRIQDKIDSESALNSIDSEIFKTAPTILQNESMDQLRRYQKTVKDALCLLNDPRLKQLLLIKTSKKYCERLARSLKQRVEAIDKLQYNLKGVDKKRDDQKLVIEATQPEIDNLISDAIQIQEFLQKRLSEILNRPVHIFGEINTLK